MLPRFLNSVDWIQLWCFETSSLRALLWLGEQSTSSTRHKGVLGSIRKFLQILQGFLNISCTTELSPYALHPVLSIVAISNAQIGYEICFSWSVPAKKSTWNKIQLKLSSRIAARPCVNICPCLLNGNPWEMGWGWSNPSAAVCFSIRAVSPCSPVLLCQADVLPGWFPSEIRGRADIRAHFRFAGVFPVSGVVAASQFGSLSCLPREEAESESRQAKYSSQLFSWGSATPFLQCEWKNPKTLLEKEQIVICNTALSTPCCISFLGRCWHFLLPLWLLKGLFSPYCFLDFF